MFENDIKDKKRKAVLVGACLNNDPDFSVSMKELEGLAAAENLEVVADITQNLDSLDSAYYIRSGKVQELKAAVWEMDADIVIVNNQLSPSQLANLAHDLEIEVIDRTNLILNIFADRARTKEAKMQVDYAKLQYMLPRLVGLRQNLSRQGGTGGSMSNKGSGETQIELDRRHIEKQMSELRKQLREVTKNRETQRKKRQNSTIPQVALVGYTNAGKSTLLNKMIETYCPDEEKEVMVKDMLFATLDTTVRKITPPDHRVFLLSDTVGFINDLPHDLVDAFRSTLEEAVNADLILEVIDYSDDNYQLHMDVTAKTLKDLNAGHIPVIYLMNKSDRKYPLSELPIVRGDKIYISADKGIGIEALLKMIDEKLFSDYITMELLIPYTKGDIQHDLQERARVISTKYEEDGIHITADLNQEMIKRYRDFLQ